MEAEGRKRGVEWRVGKAPFGERDSGSQLVTWREDQRAEAMGNLTAKIKESHGSMKDRLEFAGFVLEKWWKGK